MLNPRYFLIRFKFKPGIGLGGIKYSTLDKLLLNVVCLLAVVQVVICQMVTHIFQVHILLLSSFRVYLSVCCRSGALSDKLETFFLFVVCFNNSIKYFYGKSLNIIHSVLRKVFIIYTPTLSVFTHLLQISLCKINRPCYATTPFSPPWGIYRRSVEILVSRL